MKKESLPKSSSIKRWTGFKKVVYRFLKFEKYSNRTLKSIMSFSPWSFSWRNELLQVGWLCLVFGWWDYLYLELTLGFSGCSIWCVRNILSRMIGMDTFEMRKKCVQICYLFVTCWVSNLLYFNNPRTLRNLRLTCLFNLTKEGHLEDRGAWIKYKQDIEWFTLDQ